MEIVIPEEGIVGVMDIHGGIAIVVKLLKGDTINIILSNFASSFEGKLEEIMAITFLTSNKILFMLIIVFVYIIDCYSYVGVFQAFFRT